MTILVFIIVLVVLIVVHEFGHFVVAKWAGMRVDEFGLGYPPRLFGYKKGETLYSLNAIPFGGFVKIHGEDGLMGGERDVRAFSAKPRHIQAVVLVAGIAMNLILALVIFTGLLMAPHRVSDHEIAAALPLASALIKGVEVTWHVTSATAVALAHFFAGVLTFSADLSQVTGPVGIAGAVGAAAQSGWQSLLSLTALISINLALINLIPVPALDGGRLLFVIIESIIRRPIKPVVAQTVNVVGFALLILLMVVVTFNDIYKLAV